MPNPSSVVSAELAFARLARENGQWTAFRETADKDAVMFVPGAVNAQAWLRKRTDPPRPLVWEPHRIFVACDGSHALSTGPWTAPDGRAGTFSTIWRRQKDGAWKWILDFSSATIIPAGDEVAIEGHVARCLPRSRGLDPRGLDGRPPPGERGDRPREAPGEPAPIANPPPASGEGGSADGSLRWRWTRGADTTVFEVTMREDKGDRVVLRETAPSGGG